METYSQSLQDAIQIRKIIQVCILAKFITTCNLCAQSVGKLVHTNYYGKWVMQFLRWVLLVLRSFEVINDFNQFSVHESQCQQRGGFITDYFTTWRIFIILMQLCQCEWKAERKTLSQKKEWSGANCGLIKIWVWVT